MPSSLEPRIDQVTGSRLGTSSAVVMEIAMTVEALVFTKNPRLFSSWTPQLFRYLVFDFPSMAWADSEPIGDKASHPVLVIKSLGLKTFSIDDNQTSVGGWGCVGKSVGDAVGMAVGAFVGELVGNLVGGCVGKSVGDAVGMAVGVFVGLVVGNLVGGCVGKSVGDAVGMAVGAFVGELVGNLVGGCVGTNVGDAVVGMSIGTTPPPPLPPPPPPPPLPPPPPPPPPGGD